MRPPPADPRPGDRRGRGRCGGRRGGGARALAGRAPPGRPCIPPGAPTAATSPLGRRAGAGARNGRRSSTSAPRWPAPRCSRCRAASRGTAADQPMPVFLTDRDCSESEQLATFAITDPSLRPGCAAAPVGPVRVSGGDDRARPDARRASTAASAGACSPRWQWPRPPANVQLHLRVRAHGPRLHATVWRAGGSEPRPQLAARVPSGSGGCGVLLVHPTSLRPCRLRLRSTRSEATTPSRRPRRWR